MQKKKKKKKKKKWPMFHDFGRLVKMDPCSHFLNVKSTHLGDTFPYILYVKSSTLVDGAPK